MGVGGQRHDPLALTPGKRPGTYCRGGGWTPRSVWTGAENLAPIGIRSPDRPARSESLHLLSAPGPRIHCNKTALLIASLQNVTSHLVRGCDWLATFEGKASRRITKNYGK